ncbi:MAG: KpsF/GutQ family sugar-phosphate isomerase [Fusobacteria bacterium]|nr:KpsF/GutQ family sugar-phosphate isomerase [Fusobacteriota bacterium]
MGVLESIKEIFDIEISELEYVKSNMGDESIEAIEIIRNCKGKVVISGIGKSGLIGQKIAATLSSTGTTAVFLNSAEALHGDLGIVSKEDVVVLISNSGNGDELKSIIPVLKKQHISLIAMTGNLNSYLAAMANVVLNIHVRREGCPLNLAPMSSSTGALVMGDAIAATLMKLKGFKPENFALYHPGGALGRRLLLHVRDIMKKGEEIPFVTQEATMDEVVMELTVKKLGAVCVSENKKSLVGIITEGDLRRALLKKEEFFNLRAKDIMIKNPICATPDSLAADALGTMEERESQISVLPVLDSGDIVGMIRIHDLLGKLK